MQDTIQRHKRGGLYFEDFEVGKTYEHRYTRTVTQMDNMLFSNMTLNPQPLHIDRHFCETGNRVGPAVDEFAVHARADDRHPGFRHDGGHDHRKSRHERREISQSAVRGRYRALRDAGRVEARVEIAKGAGIVEFHHKAFKQDDTLVAECHRSAFIVMRPK